MLHKLKNHKDHSDGFTIIEVMIVLAIAGLILLIVFLAVPALQRSSRNTNRKNDASRLSTSVSDFVSNNNGKLPGPTDASSILSDAGQLGQLSLTANTTSTPTAKELTVTNATGLSEPSPAADNEVIVYVGYTCNGAAIQAGNTRQAALVYPIENTSGYAWTCISAL